MKVGVHTVRRQVRTIGTRSGVHTVQVRTRGSHEKFAPANANQVTRSVTSDGDQSQLVTVEVSTVVSTVLQ